MIQDANASFFHCLNGIGEISRRHIHTLAGIQNNTDNELPRSKLLGI